jgi:hypothetical protein
MVAELAVGVAVRVNLLVLEPQQHERHARTAQLIVDVTVVRLGTVLGRGGALREHQGLEGLVVEVLRQGPAQARFFGLSEVLGDRGVRDVQKGAHLAAGEALAQGESENVSNLAHGRRVWASEPPRRNVRGRLPVLLHLTPALHGLRRGVRKRRNGRTKSSGIRT